MGYVPHHHGLRAPLFNILGCVPNQMAARALVKFVARKWPPGPAAAAGLKARRGFEKRRVVYEMRARAPQL
jgi:hypothetical protein